MEISAELLELIIMGKEKDCDTDQERLVEDESAKTDSDAPVTPTASRNQLPSKSVLKPPIIHELRMNANSQTPRSGPPSGGITPRATPRVVPGTPRGLSTTDDQKAKKIKTTFDELSTKTGLENIGKWFEEQTRGSGEMTEDQFFAFLQNLTQFSDWEIYEIFDILDRRQTGTIGWEEFYLLLSLYSSYQSKKLTKFLYKHGSTVHAFLLDPVSRRITFERFSRLGFMIGISEDDILDACNMLGIRKPAMEMVGQEVRGCQISRPFAFSQTFSDFQSKNLKIISYSICFNIKDFMLCYFAIFNTIDSGVDLLKENHNWDASVPSTSTDRHRPGATVAANNGSANTKQCIIT